MKRDITLLNALNEGVCLLNEEGKLVFCNRRLESWLGQTTATMQGQALATLFPRFSQPHIRARLDMVKQSQAPVIFSPQIHGYLFPCPMDDGEYRLQQTTVTCLEDGCLLLSVQDFTDQIRQAKIQKASNRRLQEELTQRYVLEKQNKQLIAAMDQAAEAIMICNERAQFQYVNHTFVQQTGWSQEEALEKGVYSQLRADTDGAFEHLVMETIRSGKKWQGQQQVQRKDETLFMSNISIAPIVNAEGNITHAVAIQEDITQHILLEEQYRRTQKQEALTTLVGGIAHDFNNLLSGMLGHLYLASREVKGLPKTPDRLKKIQKSAYDAADIVKQLMTFSRRDQIDARNFPLQSFLKEMVKLIEHSVPENIEFSLDFEQYPFPMHGDPELLQQSMMNMVQNSVEACASVQHPKVHIALKMLDVGENEGLAVRYPALQYGEYADLSISDNGLGIHPDHFDRVFDPFFTTKQLGSGLGLATVMGCIRHHHGVIDVHSTLGQGTVIHMYFPLCARTEFGGVEAPHDFREVRILLVDDDPLVRETSAELLHDLGHEVVTAFDGQDAIDIFEKDEQAFDVVIMDMVMPRVNGPAAVRYIRALNSDVPVIFATAYDRSVSLEDAGKFERAMLVSKPFNPEDLNHLLATVLDENWKGEK
ncbi:MAG: response regulator [Mariprofundaceae bacterium]|nr:response regulator [Mariprofundaceae bacterium]